MWTRYRLYRLTGRGRVTSLYAADPFRNFRAVVTNSWEEFVIKSFIFIFGRP